jgi:hypothetical protein
MFYPGYGGWGGFTRPYMAAGIGYPYYGGIASFPCYGFGGCGYGYGGYGGYGRLPYYY